MPLVVPSLDSERRGEAEKAGAARGADLPAPLMLLRGKPGFRARELSDDEATLEARALDPNELSESAEAARVRMRVGLELREERPPAPALVAPLLACVLEAWLVREARDVVE